MCKPLGATLSNKMKEATANIPTHCLCLPTVTVACTVCLTSKAWSLGSCVFSCTQRQYAYHLATDHSQNGLDSWVAILSGYPVRGRHTPPSSVQACHLANRYAPIPLCSLPEHRRPGSQMWSLKCHFCHCWLTVWCHSTVDHDIICAFIW